MYNFVRNSSDGDVVREMRNIVSNVGNLPYLFCYTNAVTMANDI